MVTSVSYTATTSKSKVLSRGRVPAKPKRAPLLPSEADNNGPPPLRGPESRDVTSRRLLSTTTAASCSSSSSSSTTTSSLNSTCVPPTRFPSPLVARMNATTPVAAVSNKRAQSVERRTSTRSLLVSFQGDSFALPVTKAEKPAPTASHCGLRNGTPERRNAAGSPTRNSENLKPADQQKWPGRSQQGNFMTDVDFTSEKVKCNGSGTGSGAQVLQKSIADKTKFKPSKREIPELNNAVNNMLISDSDDSNLAMSDSESFSSRSTPNKVGGMPRAIMVPARFWQETVNRLKRVQPKPVSPPLSKNSKLMSRNNFSDNGPRGSSSSLVKGAIQPVLPSKRVISSPTSSPSRGMPNPSRGRNGVICPHSNFGNTPSILSFAAEARRGRVAEKKIVDVHVLRLLHNRHLQWRFANARADAAMLLQQAIAQKSLYNAWVTTSKMWLSVISKRTQIQQLRQNLKLQSIVKEQMLFLDEWEQIDGDHSISLSGATLALESSILRLPVVGGAKADVQNLNDAICTAGDVMQAMTSSICSLLTKVEHVNSLSSELASIMTNERSLLEQSMDLFATLKLMEVHELSLRTHTLQGI